MGLEDAEDAKAAVFASWRRGHLRRRIGQRSRQEHNDKKSSQMNLILIKLIKMESLKWVRNLSRHHREEFPCFLSMMTKKGAATMTKIPAPYLSGICSLPSTKPYHMIDICHKNTKVLFGTGNCKVFTEFKGIEVRAS